MKARKMAVAEIAPILVNTAAETIQTVCEAQRVQGVQIFVVDGELTICTHGIDWPSLVTLLENCVEIVKAERPDYGEPIMAHSSKRH
jgi:hypothetical protein